jgi:hypothetical protein
VELGGGCVSDSRRLDEEAGEGEGAVHGGGGDDMGEEEREGAGRGSSHFKGDDGGERRERGGGGSNRRCHMVLKGGGGAGTAHTHWSGAGVRSAGGGGRWQQPRGGRGGHVGVGVVQLGGPLLGRCCGLARRK